METSLDKAPTFDQPYQYVGQLDSSPEHRQLRLVTLEPGAWGDEPIRCTLQVVSFKEQPVYEALSYVWGDPRKTRPIQLNDHSFEVTENLWLVLRRLRDPATRRVLWVDAICINQANNQEKAHQVAVMGDIYRRCQNAIIWLGEDPETAETGSTSIVARRALELLHMFKAEKHLYEFPCFSASDDLRTEIQEEYTSHFDDFTTFVGAPYWTRIWVIREMVLPKAVKFLYSSEEFSYQTLRSVVHVLQTHATTCCKKYRTTLRAAAFDPLLTFQEQVEPMVTTRNAWTQAVTPNVTLFQLRRQFSAFQATKKRDLFYALLGLATDWGSTGTPLEPDYHISDTDAIINAVFKCISEHGVIEFLQGERIFRDQKSDMPSWIPDAHFTSVPSQWVMVEQRRLKMASDFSASASFRQDTSQLALAADGRTLLLQGLMVDKIDEVGVVSEALDDFEGAPDVFRDWMEMLEIGMEDWPEQPPSAGSLHDVFWKTVLNDSVELDTTASLSYRRTEEKDYLHLRFLWSTLLAASPFLKISGLRLTEELHDMFLSWAPFTVYHVFVCLWKRRMFRTERGLIGLAPRESKPGDEVHVLLGSPTPFILRPSHEPFKMEDQTEPVPSYTVIGNGYLHEIMLGQGFNEESEKSLKTIALH